jgi:hypothetical protein
MQTIAVTAIIGNDRTLRVQLPPDLPTGEYELVLVLNQSPSEPSDLTMKDAWEKWVEEVEQLQLSPQPISGDYPQHLIEMMPSKQRLKQMLKT